jgi:hypothetical protein
MSKRLRPSLKDYLKTGEVRLDSTPPDPLPANAAEEKIRAVLELLTESDRQTWEPILFSGTEVRWPSLDLAALREEFRAMDRTRFTCYILDERGVPLRVVRTSVQIRKPFALLFKWDETGVLDVYGFSGQGA